VTTDSPSCRRVDERTLRGVTQIKTGGGALMDRQRTGISNRETPAQEEQERHEFPPQNTGSPEPQDVAGRVGEAPLETVPNRHTSHKAGSRSIAQKEDNTRYPDRGMPATHKKAGAFGKEPKDIAADEGTEERDDAKRE
jgi:hypothetical protein